MEIQYREKEEACRELSNTLKFKSAQCDDLESRLAEVMERNSALSAANGELRRKVVELEDASEECQVLKGHLVKVENECDSAKSEVRIEGRRRAVATELRYDSIIGRWPQL